VATQTHYILIIDDDPDDLQWLEESLKSICATCTIQACTSAAAAITTLQSSASNQLPCIIVIDYQLPKTSAIEAIDILNQLPGMQTVNKVVWSTSPHFEQQSLQAGACSYIVKPYSVDGMNKIATDLLSGCTLHKDGR
jgi:CheY-like chemotaxis protein